MMSIRRALHLVGSLLHIARVGLAACVVPLGHTDGEPGGQTWPVVHSASCTTGSETAALALDGDESTWWNPEGCTSPFWVIYDFTRFVTVRSVEVS
eukprot:COSAG02_NODE_43638_length_373_cov_0.569343_1_plen_95_part_01